MPNNPEEALGYPFAGTEGQKAAYRVAYGVGWSDGYKDGLAASGVEKRVRRYLVPIAIAAFLVGWVLCYFLQVPWPFTGP